MKGKIRIRFLMIVLVVLVVAIVGLVAAIIMTNNPAWKNCDNIEDAYEKSGCLMEEVSDLDESGSAYEKVLNKAFSEKEYELAANLILGKAESLAIDGECEKAYQLMEDGRVHEFSDALLLKYYSYISSIATECNDEEKQAELRTLMEELDEKVIDQELLDGGEELESVIQENEGANQESEEMSDDSE